MPRVHHYISEFPLTSGSLKLPVGNFHRTKKGTLNHITSCTTRTTEVYQSVMVCFITEVFLSDLSIISYQCFAFLFICS